MSSLSLSLDTFFLFLVSDSFICFDFRFVNPSVHPSVGPSKIRDNASEDNDLLLMIDDSV